MSLSYRLLEIHQTDDSIYYVIQWYKKYNIVERIYKKCNGEWYNVFGHIYDDLERAIEVMNIYKGIIKNVSIESMKVIDQHILEKDLPFAKPLVIE